MNKTLLRISLLLIIMTCHLSFAQASKGDIELGFGGGINFATISDFEGETANGGYTAFNIAASGEYYFSDRWGIKMRLIFDNKGWGDGFVTDEDLNTIITDFRLSYLSVPVMANWHFGKRRNWYLNFGGYVGFLTSAKDTTLSLDVKELLNSTDFGLTLGIGYAFRLNERTRLFIEYDEQLGLSDIFVENPFTNSITNRRSSFNLGVLFQL